MTVYSHETLSINFLFWRHSFSAGAENPISHRLDLVAFRLLKYENRRSLIFSSMSCNTISYYSGCPLLLTNHFLLPPPPFHQVRTYSTFTTPAAISLTNLHRFAHHFSMPQHIFSGSPVRPTMGSIINSKFYFDLQSPTNSFISGTAWLPSNVSSFPSAAICPFWLNTFCTWN